MSDLFDGSQSHLGAAHRYLWHYDRRYRLAMVVAPTALLIAVAAGASALAWPAAPRVYGTAMALPPPAVPLPEWRAPRPVPMPAPRPSAAPLASKPVAAAPDHGAASAASARFADVAALRALRDRTRTDADALAQLTKEAEKGNPRAQFFLATIFDPLVKKVIGPKDAAAAIAWYEKAAALGAAPAEANLGALYWVGKDVPRDDAKAVQLFRLAANKGNTEAMYGLGMAFEHGRGVPADFAQAETWYQKAVDLGLPAAAFRLGVLHVTGNHLTLDYEKARHYFELAAGARYAPAELDLGVMYHNGQGVPKDRQQERYWLQRAADDGNLRAKAMLASPE
jgi:TPR repeat protein